MTETTTAAERGARISAWLARGKPLGGELRDFLAEIGANLVIHDPARWERFQKKANADAKIIAAVRRGR